MTRGLLTTLWALAWLCLAAGAPAASVPLNALASHGVPVATDLVPCQPAAGGDLLKCAASDLQSYVLTSVKAFGAVGDGSTDDTTALQSAINSGLPLYCPPGTYKTTATLLVTKPANDGQTIRGAGSWGQPDAFNAANPAACVIKPSSAVTIAMKIDGTPFPGGGYQASWVQGFGLETLVIDMANMTDDASHVAINQVQAWDVHYSRVRVINDGNYKRGWLFSAGAFTTTLDQPWGHIIDLEGASSSYEVTTITINNPDVWKIIANYTGSVTVNGGAVQHPYSAGVTPIVWIPAGLGPFGLDGNTAGVYVAVGTDIKNSQFFTINGTDFEAASQPSNTCTLSGWSYGTYNDTVHGCHKLVMADLIESTSYLTTVSGVQNAGTYFMDQGVGSVFPTLNQGGGYAFAATNGVQYDLGDRRIVGTLKGVVGFGGALGTETSTTWSIVGSTGVGTFREGMFQPSSDGITFYASNAAGTGLSYIDTTGAGTFYFGGQANLAKLFVKPAVDGSTFYLTNAAGSAYMICASSATIGLSNCGVGQGADWKGFSDAFSTQTYDFDAATGNGTFTETVTGAKFAGALNGSVGATTPSTIAATTITASSTIAATGVITASKGVVTTASTVAGLPASPTAGQSGFVTDATACTFASTVTGGGSTKCPVVYTGSAWIAG